MCALGTASTGTVPVCWGWYQRIVFSYGRKNVRTRRVVREMYLFMKPWQECKKGHTWWYHNVTQGWIIISSTCDLVYNRLRYRSIRVGTIPYGKFLTLFIRFFMRVDHAYLIDTRLIICIYLESRFATSKCLKDWREFREWYKSAASADTECDTGLRKCWSDASSRMYEQIDSRRLNILR